MENASMPWSLVGISADARKAVRMAAAESDQTIGQWLNDRILSAASRRAADENTSANSATNATTNATTNTSLRPVGAAHAILQRMDETLAKAEQYSATEMAAYQSALEQLAHRLYDLEQADKNG